MLLDCLGQEHFKFETGLPNFAKSYLKNKKGSGRSSVVEYVWVPTSPQEKGKASQFSVLQYSS